MGNIRTKIYCKLRIGIAFLFSVLSESKIFSSFCFQYHVLDDIDGLRHFLDEEQTPAECGGPTSHDQLEWVEFYKVRHLSGYPLGPRNGNSLTNIRCFKL